MNCPSAGAVIFQSSVMAVVPRCFLLVTFLAFLNTIYSAPLDKSVVKSWSQKVEEYLLKLSEEGLKTQELQRHYDEAIYRVESKKGSETVNSVKARLGNYFVKKEEAARVSKSLILFFKLLWLNFYFIL